MLSKSCAIRTSSTSGLQRSSWQSDKWHVFGSVGTFMRCQPFLFGLLRVMNVKAFPKCLLAAYALEHTICTMCNVFMLSSRLSSAACMWCTHVHRAAMFGHRTSDFTSVSLNIYHASQTVCKRWAANVLIFMDKRAMFTLFQTLSTTSHSHVGKSLC